MWVSKREYKLIESELDYYRQRAFSLERENARLHDAMLIANGTAPVSDEARQDVKAHNEKQHKENEERQRQLNEIFGESLTSVGMIEENIG